MDAFSAYEKQGFMEKESIIRNMIFITHSNFGDKSISEPFKF